MTDADRYRRLKELFLVASELAPTECGPFLVELGQHEPEIAADVRELLAHDAEPMSHWLDGAVMLAVEATRAEPGAAGTAAPWRELQAGGELGGERGYRLLGVLGQGGMG